MKKIIIYVFFIAELLFSHFNCAFAFWEELEASILPFHSKHLYSEYTNALKNTLSNHQHYAYKETMSSLYKNRLVTAHTEESALGSKPLPNIYLAPKMIEPYISIENSKVELPKKLEAQEKPKDKRHWMELKDVIPQASQKLTCFITEKFNKDGAMVFEQQWGLAECLTVYLLF